MIVVRHVLAGAYRGSQRGRFGGPRKDVVPRSHAVEVDERGDPVRVLCGRVNVDSLSDLDESGSPTCLACARRMSKKNPSPKSKRPKWRPLMVGGELSGLVKAEADRVSGAYAIRRARGHEVLYVGESSRGRLWRTLLRHFQAPDSFRKVRERGVFAKDASGYEVALWVTSKGARPRGKSEADQAALDAQARWIETLKPSINVDDGKAEGDDLSGPWDDAPAEEEHAFASLLNPAMRLVELGKLTRLVYEGEGGRKPSELRWSLRSAPTLAYDKAGRLFIVYGGGRVRSANAKERAEYARTHWGQVGPGEVRAASMACAPLRRLGKGLSVTYTTRKGGDTDLVDYEHPWGEGARGAWTPPVVVAHRCGAPKCAGMGMIALVGGTYRVTERGIVG